MHFWKADASTYRIKDMTFAAGPVMHMTGVSCCASQAVLTGVFESQFEAWTWSCTFSKAHVVTNGLCCQVVEDILDDDQDMEDMNLGKRAENDQLLAVLQHLVHHLICMAILSMQAGYQPAL